MEVWKNIEDYEGLYDVSNLGNVKSLEKKRWCVKNNYWSVFKERILKPTTGKHGYCYVGLHKNGIVKTNLIHKLVASSFLNHYSNGYDLVVNHIDENKRNNSVDNLEIVTQRENVSKYYIKRESSSIYTGVSFDKARNKWQARIHINGKEKKLGRFANEIDAHNTYQNALKNI